MTTRERVSLDTQIVGREEELAALRGFASGESFPGALVLSGGPGIGKTTLWEAGVALARERGIRVLMTRASGAEAQLSFAGLIDLLDEVDAGEFDQLPAPQRRALEVALLRAEPGDKPLESRAIALGFLNALRALAGREPLLVAIDDVQWLDAPSAEVLVFAARRLEGRRVGFLLARRPGRPPDLERALEPGRLQRLEVGPLSLGAVRRLLLAHLALTLPRHVLRRLVESTLGNPLFALELGRTIAEHGLPPIGAEIPVPDAVEDLLGTRVAMLSAPVRRALLAVSLSADLRLSELEAVGGTAVDDAFVAGVLVVDGDRVRASHPLLAAAVRKRSRGQARRVLHLELAHAVADEELRARHLALATEHPDVELAATLAAAAARASSRGALGVALELAEHGLRLTPPELPEHADRVLALAGHLELAGAPQRVTELLLPALDSLPPGEARVRALLHLVECVARSGQDFQRYLDLALAESGFDPRLRAYVLPAMAQITAGLRLERIREAEAWAVEALQAARRAGPEVERLALDALAWARGLRGLPVDDVCERFRAASDVPGSIAASPERVFAQRLAWRGEIDQARAAHTLSLALADERGEATAYVLQRLHLCELELRVGDCEAASRLLEEWIESPERELLPLSAYERCSALLAAGRGLPDEAERWAANEIARAEKSEARWNLFEALRARAVAALLAHEPSRAAESLRVVWVHTKQEGVDEPGVFPVAPDLVEALVELGEPVEARAVADRLRALSDEQKHPWGRATTKRCLGLIGLAAGSYDEEAAAGLAEAAADYGRLGLRFDAARSLLGLGRAQRRVKKWGAARETLERAASSFDELGSPGWAEATRSELARVGARRPQPSGELSPAERRVVELATEGLSNKEIARALFVTVKTVEAHLSRAYSKLGVRTRSQLARRLNENA